MHSPDPAVQRGLLRRGAVSALTVVAIAGVAYAAACVWLFFFQTRLIYYPSRTIEATPADVGLEFDEVWLDARDGVRVHAWFVPAEGNESASASPDTVPGPKAALFFHGNAGNISGRLQTLRILSELGLHTLIVQYRGYGLSGGSPSEAGTYDDALAGWRHLTEDRGFAPDEVVVFGRSLGGGIASWVAAEAARGGSPAAALVMESTFTSIPDVAAEIYPIFPVRLLARVRYPSLERLSALDTPLLVLHAVDDSTIPFSHGERLHAAARGPKRLVEIPGPHGNGFLRDRAGYVSGIAAFLRTLAR